MSAPMSFHLATSASRNAAQGKDELPPITFTVHDLEQVPHELTATFPPEGELLVFMSAQSIDAEDSDSAAALMGLLDSMFEREQYRLIRKWLRKGEMSSDMLTVIVQGLLEQWSGGFPTQPSPASSAPPRPTGARSTGRVRSSASTRPASGSTAS